MKKINVVLTILLLQLLTYSIYGQQSFCEKTMEESLLQTAEILNNSGSKKMWGISLNAPIIIIDHFNNRMFFTAIENGEVQSIKEEQWNNKIPLANSFFEYDGIKYVTIIYHSFINTPCKQRINLLSHEIFHLHQNSLGISNVSSVNYHMDEVHGRALLQIEMKLLQQVLNGDLQCLYDALIIRAYRQDLYHENNEDLYELNEGLAEYTGIKLSTSDARKDIIDRLNYDIKNGYTNAFGYSTGAAYALILDELYPSWKFDKDLNKGMIYLIKKENPQYSITIDSIYLTKILDNYNYNQILLVEREELKSFGDIGSFENLLKSQTSKLCIMNDNINFTYNPNDRVITLNNAVLLRNMIIKSEWGQIKVKSGIIRLNNWSAFYLLPPTKVTDNIIEGDNYEIQLNKDWVMIENNGIYKLKNKHYEIK